MVTMASHFTRIAHYINEEDARPLAAALSLQGAHFDVFADLNFPVSFLFNALPL